MVRDSKDDSGRFSALLSSSGSPRIGFSRSSSRLSFQDDMDDCEFSCPFDVDDVDVSDSSRYIPYSLFQSISVSACTAFLVEETSRIGSDAC